MTAELHDRTRRADAQRNRAAIIEATLDCLADNPRANMADIARTAGIGRVTLYGHFSSRKEVIEAAALATMKRVEAELAPLDLDGEPMAALRLLVDTSWKIVAHTHGLIAAAEQELGKQRIRDLHDATLLRVRNLIERGQAAGAFRDDQSPQWLTACFFALLHGAAGEIRAGRLTDADAAAALPDTIGALVAPPARHPG